MVQKHKTGGDTIPTRQHLELSLGPKERPSTPSPHAEDDAAYRKGQRPHVTLSTQASLNRRHTPWSSSTSSRPDCWTARRHEERSRSGGEYKYKVHSFCNNTLSLSAQALYDS